MSAQTKEYLEEDFLIDAVNLYIKGDVRDKFYNNSWQESLEELLQDEEVLDYYMDQAKKEREIFKKGDKR